MILETFKIVYETMTNFQTTHSNVTLQIEKLKEEKQ